jgi:hypothetical protein
MGSSQNAPTKNFYEGPATAVPEAPDWLELNFGGVMEHIFILNRGTAALVFSFDKGQNIHGRVSTADGGEVRDGIREQSIHLQAEAAGGACQIEAWRAK